MLLLARIALVVHLAIAVKYVSGNQRIINVNELSSGEGFSCCVYGNCSCNSFDHALTKLTSNVLINVTSDVNLSSLTEVLKLETITIIGQNNPTVNCKKVGGLHFTTSQNIRIQNITWNGCGIEHTDAIPTLKFSSSSNITIQNCSFQHSIGQAVVLSEVSGDVNIHHCQFVYNSHYKDHGATIHYSSNNYKDRPQFLLMISNCNFSYNKGAKSLVSMASKSSDNHGNITISSSIFSHNQGTSIYMKNQKVYLTGNLLFLNNTAKHGAGLQITSLSTLIFGNNWLINMYVCMIIKLYIFDVKSGVAKKGKSVAKEQI